MTIPLGFAFYMPAPELTAWYKHERILKPQDIAPKHRPPKPPPHPPYPTQPALALGLLEQCTAHHPDRKGQSVIADALSGSAGLMAGAAALFGGVQGMSQLRSHQQVRLYKREQHVADSCATHPGTPLRIRIRGGDEMVAVVGSGRL
jgi:hypothetical protein